MRAVLPVAAVFVVWDEVAIARPPVDVQPGVRHRREHPIPDADRGGAVLPGDSVVRIADLQRGRAPSCESVQPPMTGLGYTLPAVLAVLAVGALELTVLRTGLFRRPGVLDFDADRDRIPDPGRRLADQAQRADRHLRRPANQRHPFPVRHSDRGLPVRLRVGHRGAAAVGTTA